MTMTEQHAVVRLERTIPASPERVYRAWLDPRLLARWMAPGSYAVVKAEVDERPGGHYRIWHTDGGTPVGGFDCELTELVPARRLVFRWGFAGPDGRDGPVYDSLLTVTFHDAPGGGTALTLVHERLAELAAALPEVADKVGAGWADVLGTLAGVLTDGPDDATIAVLAEPEPQRLLRERPLARMAYNGTDGLPRVIPVGFLWTGADIVVCTATTSPKVRALTERPHVALTVDSDEGGEANHTLSVRGVARIEIVDGVPDEYVAASAKSYSGEQARQFEENVRATYPEMARISIRPTWARYYDYGAGRLPTFLRRLVDEQAGAVS